MENQIIPAIEFNHVVKLLDGSQIIIRPITYCDRDAILSLFNRVTSETIYLRYHCCKSRTTSEEVEKYCTLDSYETFILVAERNHENHSQIIGLAQYDRLRDSTVAEVSFMVDDKEQGKGIATHMLKDLAEIAKKQGVKVFLGELMTANSMMLDILKKYQPNLKQVMDGNTICVTFDL